MLIRIALSELNVMMVMRRNLLVTTRMVKTNDPYVAQTCGMSAVILLDGTGIS